MEANNYFPSNGTEGCWFIEKYCDTCYKRYNCTILMRSLIGKEPKQWIYNEENEPTCTSFCKKRPLNKKHNINAPTLF